MPETPGPLTGVTVGRYRIGPLLGQGGMGEVYRAEDSELRRAVALKVLPGQLVADESRLSRFVQEARTASALNHPHLISIYDIGSGTAPDDTRVHFIAMELVDGETLREFIARGTLDLRRVIEYSTQAADALAAAHAAGIVHRDLKPENLMIARNAYVKVLDFGLAKLREEPALLAGASDQPTVAAATAPGMVMGTVGYMSPEQAEGKAVDHRSDIFAFGCVLYEAATGRRAFAGTSAVDTLHQIINVDPAPISTRLQGAPPELQRIASKRLAKDPEDRYQSMKEVAIDLRGLRRQIDSGAASTVSSSAQVVGSKKRGWVAAAAIAAIALVAAGLALWNRGGTPRSGGALSITPLTATGTVIDAVISRDGKYLAYVESVGGLQTLWLRQVNGSRAIELVPPAQVGFWGITFTPDAQAVYYGIKSSADPVGKLYVIPILGGTPRQLLTQIDSTITFSPDGRRIAFYRANLGDASSRLVIADADGTNARVLAEKRPPEFFAPGFFVASSWSPDGTRLAAFVRNSTTRDARLVTIDTTTAADGQVGKPFADGTFTAWMADGSGILVSARESGTSVTGVYGTGNGGQLFLQPYPSGERRRITNDLVEYRNVSITGDGSQIVSVGFDVNVRLSLMAAGGGDERRLSALVQSLRRRTRPDVDA